jgi:hemin uptake protein HemP
MNNCISKQRIVVCTDNKNGLSRLDAKQLLGQEGRIVLEHGTEEYILRITRNGKLIMTK